MYKLIRILLKNDIRNLNQKILQVENFLRERRVLYILTVTKYLKYKAIALVERSPSRITTPLSQLSHNRS